MTGTHMLDAAIGVVFVILCFSLISSALNEALATALNWRGRILRRGLFRLLEGAEKSELVDLVFPGRNRLRSARLTLQVLREPSVRSLHGPRGILSRVWDGLLGWRLSPEERAASRLGRLPSAIPAESFSQALVDAVALQINLSEIEPDADLKSASDLQSLAQELSSAAAKLTGEDPISALALTSDLKSRLRDVVGRLSAVREIRARMDRQDGVQADALAVLDRVIQQTEIRLHGLKRDLGAWFDRAMDRVSGWYVRRTRLSMFLLGVVLAGWANVDLSQLSGRVVADAALREDLLRRAEERTLKGLPAPRPEGGPVSGDELSDDLAAAHEALTRIPGFGGPGFGRNCKDHEPIAACVWRTASVWSVLSWLLIGLGCMMGGQFWYDLLGTMLRFRPARRRSAVGT